MDNFAIIDSPGDTEIEKYLELFASKGYLYSKMLIYLINEESVLDADSFRNNNKLTKLIEIKAKYKIPLLILLTHSDTYCEKVKNENEEEWQEICKEHLKGNKNNCLSHINGIIGTLSESNSSSILKMNENDIFHILLVENTKELPEEEYIKKLKKNKKMFQKYEKANEEKKKEILENFIDTLQGENEVSEFLNEEKELNVLDQKKLIEILKEKLPSQYHKAFN